MASQSTKVTDTSQRDRQTTCDRKTALCTIVHRAVKSVSTRPITVRFVWTCVTSSFSQSVSVGCGTPVTLLFRRPANATQNVARCAAETNIDDTIEDEVGGKVDEEQRVGDNSGCLVDVVGSLGARCRISDAGEFESEE